MFDRKQAKLRYWVSVLVALIFIVPLGLFVRAIDPMDDVIWLLIAIGCTLVIAWSIYNRMMNDRDDPRGVNIRGPRR